MEEEAWGRTHTRCRILRILIIIEVTCELSRKTSNCSILLLLSLIRILILQITVLGLILVIASYAYASSHHHSSHHQQHIIPSPSSHHHHIITAMLASTHARVLRACVDVPTDNSGPKVPNWAAEHKFGTVGCVARDKYGNLAAAGLSFVPTPCFFSRVVCAVSRAFCVVSLAVCLVSVSACAASWLCLLAGSTGGLTNKQPGRIGDTPVIGAGHYYYCLSPTPYSPL
eukprot:970930-Rhodomonas_salina.5